VVDPAVDPCRHRGAVPDRPASAQPCGCPHKIGKAFSTLEQEFEREPSASELAEELDMSLFEVSDTLKISGRHLSMDAPFAQGRTTDCDVIQDERQRPPITSS